MNAATATRLAETAKQKILKSDFPARTKYDELDQLALWVMEHHPDGWAAKEISVILAAQTEVMYPNSTERK